MSLWDDSRHLEEELRRVMARSQTPSGLGLRVMARIRDEARRPAEDLLPAASSGKIWFRGGWALAACACVALLVTIFAWPREEEGFQANAADMAEVERELAEVLQLAGSQWNRAQELAFPIGQDKEHD
jgi:hypothetical protein